MTEKLKEITLEQIKEQKDFVRRYVNHYKNQAAAEGAVSENQLVPYEEEKQETAITAEQQFMIEEMESVLYSISFGAAETIKKVKYQAYSAAISNQNHVDLCLSYLEQRPQIASAKSVIVAYRVTQGGDEALNQDPNAEPDSFVTEGFDDGNEEGCGQKLLSLL